MTGDGDGDCRGGDTGRVVWRVTRQVVGSGKRARWWRCPKHEKMVSLVSKPSVADTPRRLDEYG